MVSSTSHKRFHSRLDPKAILIGVSIEQPIARYLEEAWFMLKERFPSARLMRRQTRALIG